MFRPARLSYDDIRRLSEEFLDEFHEERSIPTPVEEIAEFDFELEIVPIDGIHADLGVDAFLSGDLTRLFADEFIMSFHPKRYRFSVAHELAHFVLHEPLYREQNVQTVQDWRRVQESLSADDYAWFEYQANSFAGLVLVPTDALKAQFSAAVKAVEAQGLSRQTIQTDAGRSIVARWIADQFNVSTQVVERRLGLEGL